MPARARGELIQVQCRLARTPADARLTAPALGRLVKTLLPLLASPQPAVRAAAAAIA
jgi:hypothetical protein